MQEKLHGAALMRPRNVVPALAGSGWALSARPEPEPAEAGTTLRALGFKTRPGSSPRLSPPATLARSLARGGMITAESIDAGHFCFFSTMILNFSARSAF